MSALSTRESELIVFALRHYAAKNRREAGRCARVGKDDLAAFHAQTTREVQRLIAKIQGGVA